MIASALRKLAHAIYIEFVSTITEKFIEKKNYILNIFAQNINCGYTLEPPRQGGSNKYPESLFGSKIRKIGLLFTLAYPSFAV